MRTKMIPFAVALLLCAGLPAQGQNSQPSSTTAAQQSHITEQLVAARGRSSKRGAATKRDKQKAGRNKETERPGIRVGLIRCDLHGNYYGALMEEHSPELLRQSRRYGGGAYFYFYQRYNDPTKMTAPRVPGFNIAKVWDKDPKLAQATSKIFLGRPKVCKTFEEVSDDVDLVFIANCNFDGSDHLELATPGIKKGVPTFIDKPLSLKVEDAAAIVKLAEEHKTPILSLSILRTLPHAARFKQRIEEVGDIQFATIVGGGNNLAGQIHAVSLAQHLFGNGVIAVSAMGKGRRSHIFLDYGNKKGRPRHGAVLNCDRGPAPHCSFYVSIYGSEGAAHSPAFSDFEFPWGAAENLKLVKKMVETRAPPVPYDDMIENIAVAAAARLARKQRRLVFIGEVWKR